MISAPHSAQGDGLIVSATRLGLPVASVLVATSIVAMAYQEEALDLLLLLAAAMSVFVALLSRTVYVLVTCSAVAMLHVNLVGIDPSEILFPTLLIVGLLARHLNLRRLPLPAPLAFLCMAFAASYVASMLTNFELAEVGHVASNIVFFCFLVLYIDSPHRMKHVMGSFAFGAIVAAAFAVAAIVGIWSPPNYFFEVVRDFRFMGLLGDPNIVALSCSIVVVWLYDEMLAPKLLRLPRWMLGLGIVIALAQLALTQSRAGWLNLLVTFLCYGACEVYKGRLRHAIKLLAAALVTGTLSLAVVVSIGAERLLLNRLESFVTPELDAERVGMTFTRNALGLAADNPLGVGPGHTALALGQFNVDGIPIGAHNSYVQILVENGWLAFVLLLLILVFIGRSVVIRVTHEQERFGVSFPFLAAALAGLAANAAFHDLIAWKMAWLIPCVAGVALWGKPRFRAVLARPSNNS
jgi:O-antigen ligase